MSRICYVTSGKVGIHSFTFNELVELNNEHEFLLCLTQLNSGPYMPEPSWRTIIASKRGILAGVLSMLIFSPMKLLKVLYLSLKQNHFREALLAINFYNEIKEIKIDVVHCQIGDHKLFISNYLKKLLGVPLTTTIHAHELYMREFQKDPAKQKLLYNECEKIITISNYNKQFLMDNDIVYDSKVDVMRLFPRTEYIDKLTGKIKILIVANWVEKKGYRVLLEAIQRIKRKDIVLLVVGGTNKNTNSVEVDKLARKMNIEDQVIILGRFGSPLIDLVFYACDIFCLPSLTDFSKDGIPATKEGIPVALMEAMSWGKPVISTRHAGIPELVEEVLIDENNVDDLAGAINYLADNMHLWAEMGRRNKEIIRTKYTSDNVKILSNVFNNIIR